MIASSTRGRGLGPAHGAHTSKAKASAMRSPVVSTSRSLSPWFDADGGGVDATTESLKPRTARSGNQWHALPLPHTEH
jgi:hypothetical protein